MSGCTWQGCMQAGVAPQRATDGEQWALLCSRHDHELVDAVQASPRQAIGAWVKAQGGAAAAAARMQPEKDQAAGLLSRLGAVLREQPR